VDSVTLRATDNGTPVLHGDVVVSITVNEVNKPPVLGAIGNKSVNELVALAFTATATDLNSADTRTFSLDPGAPPAATINPTTGVFAWVPPSTGFSSVNAVTIRVTDNGTPAMSDEESITVTVAEVNVAPILASIGTSRSTGAIRSASRRVPRRGPPANTLTYSLVGAPAGAAINSSTGAFTWTPGVGQVGSTFTVKVTDNGAPVLDDTESITVTGKRPTTLSTMEASPGSIPTR
jgi:hypothetical protein